MLVLAVLLAYSRPVFAERSEWFGRDKMQHFALSALVSAGGFGLGASLFDSSAAGLSIGGLLALAAGGGKELYDLAGHGDPDWRDFLWDIIGTTIGLLIAWSIERCLTERRRTARRRTAVAFARSPP